MLKQQPETLVTLRGRVSWRQAGTGTLCPNDKGISASGDPLLRQFTHGYGIQKVEARKV